MIVRPLNPPVQRMHDECDRVQGAKLQPEHTPTQCMDNLLGLGLGGESSCFRVWGLGVQLALRGCGEPAGK